jgi:hypothetical protein
MACKKGKKVETGVWHLTDSQLYLGEVNYTNPSTGHRDRKRKTTHRLDLAREWRKTPVTDALRKDVRREKRQRTIPFSKFATEYLEKWWRLVYNGFRTALMAVCSCFRVVRIFGKGLHRHPV